MERRVEYVLSEEEANLVTKNINIVCDRLNELHQELLMQKTQDNDNMMKELNINLYKLRQIREVFGKE